MKEREYMPEWNTVLSHEFRRPELAKTALDSIYRVAKLEGIPENATWSTSVRGIGIIVFATWSYPSIEEKK